MKKVVHGLGRCEGYAYAPVDLSTRRDSICARCSGSTGRVDRGCPAPDEMPAWLCSALLAPQHSRARQVFEPMPGRAPELQLDIATGCVYVRAVVPCVMIPFLNSTVYWVLLNSTVFWVSY
jgi:hypothetical protein